MRKLHMPFLCKVFCISRSSHSLNIKPFIMGVYVVWSEHQAVHHGCLCCLIWTSSRSLWVFMLSDLNIKQFIMGVYVVWSEHQAVHYGCLCCLIWTSSSSWWVFMLSDLNIKQFIMGVYVVWSETDNINTHDELLDVQIRQHKHP
jgi:hypothetical protein